MQQVKNTNYISLQEWTAVASWLVRSSLDRVVRVRALAEDIVLCSWARHSLRELSQCLSPPRCMILEKCLLGGTDIYWMWKPSRA